LASLLKNFTEPHTAARTVTIGNLFRHESSLAGARLL
jgi:hypothetical protein